MGFALRIGYLVWEIAVAEGGAGALLVPRLFTGRSYAYSHQVGWNEDLLPWCESSTAAIPTGTHRVRDSHDQVFLEWPWRQPPLCWWRLTPTYWPSKRQFERSRSWTLRISNPGCPLTAEPSPKDDGLGLLLRPTDPAGTLH
jgi:hypothetical protein